MIPFIKLICATIQIYKGLFLLFLHVSSLLILFVKYYLFLFLKVIVVILRLHIFQIISTNLAVISQLILLSLI
jgi:hypothetical protein